MRATLYAWKGSPSEGRKEPFGEVRIDASSGRAVWDPSLDPYFTNMPRDPRTGENLDPRRGHDFILAMPYVFRSAPYTWAEVSEIATEDLRLIIAAAKTQTDAHAAKYLSEVWLAEHPGDESLADELDSLALMFPG